MKKLDERIPNTPQHWGDHWTRYIAEGKPKDHGDKPFEILRNIEPGETVLDVGTGIGEIPELIKKVRPNLDIAVCDISRSAIAYMKKQEKPFSEIFHAEIYGVNRPDNSYDVVFCTEVLEHLHEPRRAVRELVRLARKKVIITVPYKENTTDLTHKWAFDLDDIWNMLSPYGMVELRVINGRSNICATLWIS